MAKKKDHPKQQLFLVERSRQQDFDQNRPEKPNSGGPAKFKFSKLRQPVGKPIPTDYLVEKVVHYWPRNPTPSQVRFFVEDARETGWPVPDYSNDEEAFQIYNLIQKEVIYHVQSRQEDPYLID